MSFHCPNCNVELAVMRANSTMSTPLYATQPAPQVHGLFCPVHGTAAIIKPAGFRKDGTSYPAFPVCPDPSCRARPQRQNGAQQPTTAPVAPQGYGLAPDPNELP
jgi:predicted RNA-binding Zn-ribbon protein involved in translation (DUF1610 family)